jgi:hypothetical protein
MPVWGPIFQYLENYNESAVGQRIKNLCDYLESIQENDREDLRNGNFDRGWDGKLALQRRGHHRFFLLALSPYCNRAEQPCAATTTPCQLARSPNQE